MASPCKVTTLIFNRSSDGNIPRNTNSWIIATIRGNGMTFSKENYDWLVNICRNLLNGKDVDTFYDVFADFVFKTKETVEASGLTRGFFIDMVKQHTEEERAAALADDLIVIFKKTEMTRREAQAKRYEAMLAASHNIEQPKKPEQINKERAHYKQFGDHEDNFIKPDTNSIKNE